MNKISISGTLHMEAVRSSIGLSLRTSFKEDGEVRDVFACWTKASEVSGNIRSFIEGCRADHPESLMMGFTSFSQDAAMVLQGDAPEAINTFGIGEKCG